ncbi:inorganic phosphate transmembrane transporter [Aureococcus anophagefferens]|nr:inorganic phosphate transmembrane transporter [Aureococcus anophagefferens]
MKGFSVTSAARGMGVLLLVTLASEISANRSDWEQEDYTWLIVCAGILAFCAAWGIGANDVANAYATSVGSKAITVKQAVMLASVFEFLGALLMGSNVSKTIRKGIADVKCFDDNPGLLMYGMTCVIIAVAVWLLVASYLEMPVSTTHSCVGGIIGMAMMSRGRRCIAVSWVLSPIASGFCAAILYGITKYVVLESSLIPESVAPPHLRAKVLFPFIVAFTFGVNSVFWIVKGTKGQPERFGTSRLVREAKAGNLAPAIEVGGMVAACGFALAALAVIPMSKWVDDDIAAKEAAKASAGDDAEKGAAADAAPAEGVVGDIHANVKHHDAKAEGFFRYVQVFTAIVDSFSHGANDVANAMGPFAAAYVAYKKGKVVKSQELTDGTMMWILAIGGVGIVVGLATYGYKIMNAMGVKLTAITPSRGYCIELGAAFVIIYGTAQGWPLSTTHCQVGATVAVGLFEGTAGVNGKLFAKTCFGWIITLVVVGTGTAILVGPSPEPLKDEYCADWAAVHYN